VTWCVCVFVFPSCYHKAYSGYQIMNKPYQKCYSTPLTILQC
jgi:hypothetical protein